MRTRRRGSARAGSGAGRIRLVPAAILLLAVLVGALLGHVGRASTAGNTIPTGLIGQGSSTTSKYTISAIAYKLDVNNPRFVSQVAFTIAPANPRIVEARLFAGGSWYLCSNTAGSVTCSTAAPTAPATSANSLTVVATQ